MAGGGLVAVEREARPRVHVEQHQLAGRRRDRVTAVHLEAERGGRAAHEPARAGARPAGVRPDADPCDRTSGTTAARDAWPPPAPIP